MILSSPKLISSSSAAACVHARTFKVLQEEANQGNAKAQKELADGYLKRANEYSFRDPANNFPNTRQEWDLAKQWYEKAAVQDFPDAQFQLGLLYYHGKGVKQDFDQALFWFRTLSERGDPKACCVLGNAHYFGRGVQQNFAAAAACYSRAEALPEARNNLGGMYERGEGVVHDYVKATSLYSLRRGYPSFAVGALCNLIRLARAGKGGSVEEIEEIKSKNKATAGAAMEALARMGKIQDLLVSSDLQIANFQAGCAHEIGFGAVQDSLATIDFMTRSANAGYLQAQQRIARYLSVMLCPDGLADEAESAEWCRKAAEKGDAFSQSMMSHKYANGRGVPIDREESVRWCELAARQGHSNSQYSLALGYRGWRKDPEKALYWMKLAAEAGHAQAQMCLDSGLLAGED